jgi:hypothetical protein
MKQMPELLVKLSGRTSAWHVQGPRFNPPAPQKFKGKKKSFPREQWAMTLLKTSIRSFKHLVSTY